MIRRESIMKKKFKSIIGMMMCAAMITASAVACGGKGDESGGGSESVPSSSSEVIYDKGEHLAQNTLHKVNITENSQRAFVTNKKTDYTIIFDNNGEKLSKAVDLIVKNVNSATGATLKTEIYTEGRENEWKSDDKVIVFDNDEIFKKAGLTMPADDIGNGGYYIKTVGNTVFIMCASTDGYQLGAIKFLEATVGYDMLAADCVVFEKSGETMPDMDIIEKPDYEYRMTSTFKLSSAAIYGMGFNMDRLDNMFIAVPNRETGKSADTQHNSFNFLPPSMYNDESNPEMYHPKWYSHAGNINLEQLCYTAHGDTAEYGAMVDTLYEYLKELVDANPDKKNITITHQDNQAYCDCETCLNVVRDYGAISAAYIMFLNDVDDKLQADLAKEAEENGTEKREVNLIFFAYHGTKESPTYLGEDGKYHATSEKVMMNENVGVLVAPIESYYTSSFYEEKNIDKGESEQIKSWSCLTDKIYMWTYETYFNNYMYPYNTWDSMVENYRFCLENNAVYMFNQGQTNQSSPTGFMAFKYYIDSKAGINVNVSYAELEEKFFRGYFKEAAEPMKEYFDALRAKLSYLENTYNETVDGGINNGGSNVLAKKQYWDYRTLTGYIDCMDRATEAIAKYEAEDPDTYTALKNHITIESLFPRYALITLYGEQMSSEQSDGMKKAFVEDCNALGVTNEGESDANKKLSTLFAKWGY